MGDHEGPSRRDPVMPVQELEIWLVGTPADVDAALAALCEAGQARHVGRPQRMAGAGTGRVSRYLRITRTTTARAGKPTRHTAGQGVLRLVSDNEPEQRSA